jgi:hypothetical protein
MRNAAAAVPARRNSTVVGVKPGTATMDSSNSASGEPRIDRTASSHRHLVLVGDQRE